MTMTADDTCTAVTATQLFQALAICSRIDDLDRRQMLMRGVLQEMASVAPAPSATHDPAWADVVALVVRPRLRAKRNLSPLPPERLPGLWLEVSLPRAPWPVGTLVQWTWRLQGREQCVIGRVEQHRPLMVRVHREFYAQAGQPVADFVRAYDGLRRVGFTATQAQTVVGEVDPVKLLEIVIRAYHKRHELQSPTAYVRACIRENQAA